MASALVGLLLSYPEIIFAIACFLCAFFYYQSTKKSLIPLNWPVVGMLPAIVANIDRLHEYVTDALREAGCTFEFRGPWLLGLGFLLTCDPANVNHVFNVNFANYPKGDEFSEMLDIFGNGIITVDHESWKSQRKRAIGVMHSQKFRAFIARCSREKVEKGLVPLLSELARKGDVFDLQDVFLRLTFDTTCNLLFGVDPGCLSEGFPTIPFARAMDDAMEAVFFRHIVPPSCWKAMRWLKIGKERKLIEARRVMDHFVAENMRKRKEEGIFGDDLLTSYIEDAREGDDDRFLRDTTVTLMLGGRDTTGVALSWLFWLLANNPRVKSKILDEMTQRPDEEVAKLVYLHAAMLESLRLYPSVPFEHKRPIQAETLPSGVRARANQKILFSTYSMGRMEGIWGKDCSEFRPERWISERGGLRHEPSYKFLSFNCGPRTCLGKEMAFTQMKAVAAAMLCNFDVELAEGHVVEPKLSIILHMKNGLMVRVKKRTQL